MAIFWHRSTLIVSKLFSIDVIDNIQESVTFARVDRTVGKIVTWDFDVFFTVASLKVKSKFVFTGLAQA